MIEAFEGPTRRLTDKIMSENNGTDDVSLDNIVELVDKLVNVSNGDESDCDCLDETCDGCYFSCRKCNSPKCGHTCRRGRQWNYEYVLEQSSQQEPTFLRRSNK